MIPPPINQLPGKLSTMKGNSLLTSCRALNPVLRWGGVIVLLTRTSIASAEGYDPLRTLGRVDGLTDLQQRTGDAVQAVCGAFIANGVDQTREDVAQQTILFDKCGEMVTTARVLTGEEGGTGGNLGINSEQLGAALIVGRYETELLRGATRVVEPFASSMQLRCDDDGVWRCFSVTSGFRAAASWPIDRPK